jgi:hypothetical protein
MLALGDFQGLPEGLVVGRLVAVAKVAGDRAAEQEGLLRHDADQRQRFSRRRLRTSTPSMRTLPEVTS